MFVFATIVFNSKILITHREYIEQLYLYGIHVWHLYECIRLTTTAFPVPATSSTIHQHSFKTCIYGFIVILFGVVNVLFYFVCFYVILFREINN